MKIQIPQSLGLTLIHAVNEKLCNANAYLTFLLRLHSA